MGSHRHGFPSSQVLSTPWLRALVSRPARRCHPPARPGEAGLPARAHVLGRGGRRVSGSLLGRPLPGAWRGAAGGSPGWLAGGCLPARGGAEERGRGSGMRWDPPLSAAPLQGTREAFTPLGCSEAFAAPPKGPLAFQDSCLSAGLSLAGVGPDLGDPKFIQFEERSSGKIKGHTHN